ncbi:autotransporter family protein [Rahnella selenatireducens]|uniref:autotransporter family protein n=1 Tax=Rahnella selenatireducens TaxID=3389797 RepID=UPI003969B6EB
MGNNFTINSNMLDTEIHLDNTVTDSTLTIDSKVIVKSTTGDAVTLFVDGGKNNTIINNGSIFGPVELANSDGLVLTNNGNIIDDYDNHPYGAVWRAINKVGSNSVISNNEGAVIIGTKSAIAGSENASGITINNAGFIGSDLVAIQLYGDNNTLNLATTSVIKGDVQMMPGQTNNVLNLLGGTTDVGTFDNYVNDSSFNFLNIDAAGKEWDLSGELVVADTIHVIAGKTVVTGDLANSGSGATTIDKNATLQIGNGGETGTLDDNVVNEGELIFNRTNAYSFGNSIGGSGNLIKAGAGELTLGGTSDYTGITWLNDGAIVAGSDNALGNTSALVQAEGTSFDLNGKSQTVGSLSSAAGSTLDINNGTMTISHGGESDGGIVGKGNLIIDNGIFNANGDNAAFGGTFVINEGATLVVEQNKNLGSSAATVNDNGLLQINNNTDWALTQAVTGTGGLNKNGTGTLIVNHGLTYTGDTHVSQGTLQIGETQGSLDSTGTVYIDNAATLQGNGAVAGSVVNNGRVGMLSSGSSHLTVAGDFENNGVIDLTGNTTGNALTVGGNYTSNDGMLWVNTSLSDDNSSTDKLYVEGNTRGKTTVRVNNMHGLGDATVNGIELVDVQGQSEGTFVLQGRAVAGAYEYSLYQGTSTGNDGNWYLRSSSEDPDSGLPPDPNLPPDPILPPDDNPSAPVIRPEAGAYLANQSLANSVFLTTMHDRNGENRETWEESAAGWAHFDAGRVNSRAAGDNISLGSNTAVLRAGTDIYRHDFGDQQVRAGLMTGYADADTDSSAKNVSGNAKSNLKGYSFGAYGTWYGGAAGQKTGPYVDSWIQYGTFHNTVNGDDLAEEKYDSHNWVGSLEAGYDLSLSNNHALYFQPQVQTIYTRYSQGDHTESNGTQIHSQDAGGLTTRLGGRLYGQFDDKGTTQPFAEVNWWHGGSSNSVEMDSTSVEQSIPVNRYEVKVGAQAQISKDWLLWINTGVQAGKDDYSAIQGQVGGKYFW